MSQKKLIVFIDVDDEKIYFVASRHMLATHNDDVDDLVKKNFPKFKTLRDAITTKELELISKKFNILEYDLYLLGGKLMDENKTDFSKNFEFTLKLATSGPDTKDVDFFNKIDEKYKSKPKASGSRKTRKTTKPKPVDSDEEEPTKDTKKPKKKDTKKPKKNEEKKDVKKKDTKKKDTKKKDTKKPEEEEEEKKDEEESEDEKEPTYKSEDEEEDTDEE